MEKVSIVIPMYNSGHTLTRCLDSIINQNYQNLEIVLVDDGSTDNTKEIVEQYMKKDPRIIYIYKENGGVSSARNRGIEHISGDFVTFIDPDDMLAEDVIKDMKNMIEQNKCDFVRFNYYLSNEQNLKMSVGKNLFQEDTLVKKEELQEEVLESIIEGKLSTFVWILMIRREFLEKINLFNEKVDYMEDKLFYIDLFSKSQSYFLSNKCTYFYFFKEFENRSIEFWEKYLKNINIVYTEMVKILEHNGKNNTKLKDKISITGLSLYNEVIYKIYCKDNKVDIEKLWKKCEITKNCNLKNVSGISKFSKQCLKLFYKQKYAKMKLLYQIKKVLKSR
ncbi:MAG: glycosyltransferase [Clostridia bacterium]|jgi:glycosyltransferase involved in cell wall biosynthesis|nr:glycosyltransferase [Clostridia bacterium]